MGDPGMLLDLAQTIALVAVAVDYYLHGRRLRDAEGRIRELRRRLREIERHAGIDDGGLDT